MKAGRLHHELAGVLCGVDVESRQQIAVPDGPFAHIGLLAVVGDECDADALLHEHMFAAARSRVQLLNGDRAVNAAF